MNLGELRHRVRLETPTRVADGDGGYTETWALLSPGVVWARIEPATARNVERSVGAKVDAPVDALITIRHHAGVGNLTRVVYDGRRYLVRGVQDVQERGRWLVLACEEQTT